MVVRRKMLAKRVSVLAVPLVALAAFLLPTSPATASQAIALGGTSSPRTGDYTPSGDGDVTQAEFPGQMDGEDGPDAYQGSIVDRSLSKGTGNGVSVNSGKKAKSSPQLNSSFEGLNFYQQRYARGGNQFSLEPPDQGLCVGNGYVLEAVNDVLNIYNSSGQSVLPDNTATNIVAGFPRNVNHAVDLNSFYGYPPAINRSTGVRGQFVTDPTCLYDAATQRFFVVVLTLNTNPNGSFTLVNHLDLAVSQTSNPTGTWNIYRLDVTNDGSNPSPANACPCLGDYPHIGADANGIFLTTNAYPWNGVGFDGAQIYALSKAQLAAGAPSVNMVHLDTFGTVNAPSDAGSTQPGFTLWPAQSPGVSSFDLNAGGTEYLLSSNAADEATSPVAGTGGPATSSQIVTWAVTNTSSLNTASPSLGLSNKLLSANQYAVPPKQQQPGSGTLATIDTPQGYCINNTTTTTIAGVGCWRLLFGGAPAHDELISRPDSNDTRMQQVMYANGKLWGALDTALNPGGGPQRAGIAWYIVKPDVSTGSLGAKMALQGYLGVTGADLTYPAIGVTPSGRGVMAFTFTGNTTNPSAGYAPIDGTVGVGPYSLAATGAAQDDGFTSYKSQVGNPPRTRWGDYGAAAVDGNSVWIASEYIAQACQYTAWGGPFFAGGTGDNLLGTCGGASHGPGARAALGNWSTRISKLTP
ncbi:MAG: hypothetical protein M3P23_01640 [Actinomycetota bacterium]|nr:hypothetical protein [Actinomycetota bacterium]